MNPKFFKHKMKEVKNFLHIMYGKITRNEEERIKGIDMALNELNEERKSYELERKKALQNLGKKNMSSQNDKSIRESSSDISPI